MCAFMYGVCYQMIAKPGNKTAPPSWPDSYAIEDMLCVLAHVGILQCTDSEIFSVAYFRIFQNDEYGLTDPEALRF